jgi:hypothetical protein
MKQTVLPDETTLGRGTSNSLSSSSSSSPPPSQLPKPPKSKLVVDVKPTSTMKSHHEGGGGHHRHRLPPHGKNYHYLDPQKENEKEENKEFPPDTAGDRKRISAVATRRIVRMAANRVLLEPSALSLLTLSTSAVLGIGAMEATLLTSQVPFVESMDAGFFVGRYALEQLLPSCVWETQNATLVAMAMGYDPAVLLQPFQPETVAADATTILRVQLLAATRCMAAGFMLLAQLVRAGTIGASAMARYESRIKAGREPPILILPGSSSSSTHHNQGLVLRLCGRESHVTSTSLRRMGRHLFPIFEEPDAIQHLVKEFSQGKKVPMYWCVRPGRYGTMYSWQGLFDDSASNISSSKTKKKKKHQEEEDCYYIRTRTGEKVLILEADATNSDDPLALGHEALDLTIDDASQGFRRITEQFQKSFATTTTTATSSSSSRLTPPPPPPFRTLRVFLGNSLETTKTGGGHEYTLRHRIRYAKEVDVLIDSRAPVLQEILNWCNRVTTTTDRIILFQTSSRQYFLSLQLIMKQYGYRICDPLDWKLASQLEEESTKMTMQEAPHETSTTATTTERSSNVDPQLPPVMPLEAGGAGTGTDALTTASKEYDSLLQILMEDSFFLDTSSVFPPTTTLVRTPSKTMTATPVVAAISVEETKASLQKAKEERKRHAMKLARLPRLVYYGTTAETVNAVEALLNAGAADIANCCALLDKEEGMHLLTRMIQEETNMVQQGPMEWGDGDQRTLRTRISKENRTEVSSSSLSSASSSSGQHSSTSTSPATMTMTKTTPRYGLHIISSSEIYDDLFRQVRQWTRMGYTAANIQMELDTRFQEILQQSKEVHDKVTEVTTTEAGTDGRGGGTSGKGSGSAAPLPPRLEEEDDSH